MGVIVERHPVVIADASGVIRYWSAGAELAFGYRASEAVGRELEMIVPADYREAHLAGFRRAIECGHAETDGTAPTFPVQSAGGGIIPSQGFLTLLRNSQRQVIGVMVAFDVQSDGNSVREAV